MKVFSIFNDLVSDISSITFLSINFFDIFIILIAFLISILVRGIFARFIIKKITKLIISTGNKIDDKLFFSLSSPLKLLPIVFVFIFISLYVEINSNLGIYFDKINRSLVTIFVFWFFHQLFTPLSFFFKKLEIVLTKALVEWILKSIKIFIIFLGIVAVLEIWGIKIGPVIAGLGLFGVAVALGAQDLFKNLISGILIILEKGFKIGDVISVPSVGDGIVEHIGFRSTKIRKFDSTPVTIPNFIFAESVFLNYSQRFHRRINWIVGLEYSTSTDQLKNITESINNYISSSSDEFIVNENFSCNVRVEKFNDSSIDILINCFTKTNDWQEFLKIKENLLINIKKIVEHDFKANFAFPSTSIYVEKK